MCTNETVQEKGQTNFKKVFKQITVIVLQLNNNIK